MLYPLLPGRHRDIIDHRGKILADHPDVSVARDREGTIIKKGNEMVEDAKNAEIKAFGEKVIKDQSAQIAQMKEMLARLS